jgi:hypothetical protein
VGGEDQPAADRVGDLGAEVPADHVQAQVEGGRAASRGEDVAVVDEEHVRFELDRREPGPEVVSPLPVRGGPAPVQDTGLGQGERAAAEAHQPRAAGPGAPDRREDGRAPGHVDVRAVGHDQGVRPVGRLQPGDAGEREEAVAHQRAGRGGAEAEVVQVTAQLGAAEAEDLGRAAQLERVGVLVDEDHNPVQGFLRHLRFLALPSAPGQGRR